MHILKCNQESKMASDQLDVRCSRAAPSTTQGIGQSGLMIDPITYSYRIRIGNNADRAGICQHGNSFCLLAEVAPGFSGSSLFEMIFLSACNKATIWNFASSDTPFKADFSLKVCAEFLGQKM